MIILDWSSGGAETEKIFERSDPVIGERDKKWGKGIIAEAKRIGRD